MSTYYDRDDVFEFYWGMDHGTWELFVEADPSNPKSMRTLADKLLAERAFEDDQIPPHPGELALLLAANAHAYQREFVAGYGATPPELSFEERECAARGWTVP